MSTHPARHHRARLTAVSAVLLVGALALTTLASTASAAPTPPAPAGQGAVPDSASALGSGFANSSDVLVTGVGDTGGYHLFTAREKDAFAWKPLATVGAKFGELGPLTGFTCVTGSGNYAAVVYAPALAVNRPALLQAGGFAAIVDLRTGQVRQVATQVQVAYFNPACGAGDRVLFTRSINGDDRARQQTDLLTVDAARATVTSTRRVNGQVTTPVPAADGDYGIVRGALARIEATGSTTAVATPAGRPFALSATGHGAIDMVSAAGDRAVAQRYAHGALTGLGSGPRTGLQLFGLSGGRSALVGDVTGVPAAADLDRLTSDRQVSAVSGQGHLLLVRAVTSQARTSVDKAGVPADPRAAGSLEITVRATHSGRSSTATVPLTVAAPDAAGAAAPASSPSFDSPPCAVPRNDLHRQVLQPSPNMVEWAVDEAVQGKLTVSRPANYLKTGQPAYTPQGMFKYPTSVRVPAQVMLGILAQESNVSQASWHAVPGDAGNPLIADYYGNGGQSLSIHYDNSDCGYGIAQVTDGMRVTDTGVNRTNAQQVAIATDYAANIAAALQILAQKWVTLKNTDNTYVNNGDPRYVENWFLALWGYNSGVYTPAGGGWYGVGWLNNPANPAYPANRLPFLRYNYGDASHPSDWPYEERVLGWIETPQLSSGGAKYAEPLYGPNHAAAARLDLPYDPLEVGQDPALGWDNLFCGAPGQACNPGNVSNPCPNTDSSCWWHGTASWAQCPNDCATESLTYPVTASEPAITRVYPTACTKLTAPSGHTLTMVDDIFDSSLNLLGCSAQTQGGKFVLRTGSPTGDGWSEELATEQQSWSYDYSYYAQIDLHQLGAGYLGHTWFTHTYPQPATANSPNDGNYQQIVASWTPDLPSSGKAYDILVHLPSHGGAAMAEYDIFTSGGDVVGARSCVIDQSRANGSDIWVYLPTTTLSTGARVQLSNTANGGDGTTDIAFDAIAFISATSGTTHNCGDPHP